MKQIISSVFMMAVLMCAIVACNDDVISSKHVYTEAEIKMRDSLEAAKNNIKANYIVTNEVTLPLDTVNYRSVEVAVDPTVALEKLGFATLSELITSLGTVAGGVQTENTSKFLAINNSTRYDYTGAFTASGFGYWYDKNGDVCTWDKGDALFNELTLETFTFNIGQHPKHVKTGEKYKLIQIIQNGDYRVAFVFNVTIGEYYEEPKATNLATTELTLEVTPNNDYTPTDLAFSFADAAKAFGVSESELGADSKFCGISSDGKLSSLYTADAGYWYSNTGDVIAYGDPGCSYYVNYAEGKFSIGQFPDACKPGDEFKVSVALIYKTTKMVTYNITIKVVEPT